MTTRVRHGVRIEARGVTRSIPGGDRILSDATFAIEAGELVAIAGGSGAGKTTLLEALASVAPPDDGVVSYDGVPLHERGDSHRSTLGFVPQDDIIHTELELARTLTYAARLRLPPGTPPAEIDERVSHALAALDLTARASTQVGRLSGGQRKRASIAVELLTSPSVFFLDEPTSGLDPATSAELLRSLRNLTTAGATVVLTTHAVQDLGACDRVIFLASGGRVVFAGPPETAPARFGVSALEDVYGRLNEAPTSSDISGGAGDGAGGPDHAGTEPAAPRRVPGPLRQWSVLTARAFETMVRNRLTLAILLGSPLMIVAMFAILFEAGAFEPGSPDPTSILMILFWITFGAFFFGLTYGLLQIVTERAIVRRERLVGLRLGPYLWSKVTVLLPFLALVNVVMLVVLRALDRLPAAPLSDYVAVWITLGLDAAAALTLGLLASAAVSTPSQATLALPMLCFPAVLFSGAILPVHVMATVGRWISAAIPVRWSFEAVGRSLGVRELLLEGGSPLGPPLVASFGEAGLDPVATYWTYLAAFTAIFFLGAAAVLARSLRKGAR